MFKTRNIPIRNTSNTMATVGQTKQIKPNQCRSVLTSTDQLVSIDRSHIQSSDCVTTVLLYCNLSLCQSCQPGHLVSHPSPSYQQIGPARINTLRPTHAHPKKYLHQHTKKFIHACFRRLTHDHKHSPTQIHTVLQHWVPKELADTVRRLKASNSKYKHLFSAMLCKSSRNGAMMCTE